MKTLLLLLLLVLIPVAVFAVDTDGMETRTTTTMIVVHYSETNGGSVEAFRQYHVRHYGWPDIGYHFVVFADGRVEAGRRENAVGAQAKENGRNHISLGVCLVGKNYFPKSEQEGLVNLLARLCVKYHIKPSRKTIQRHHEECPGPGLDLDQIINQVKEAITTESYLYYVEKTRGC